MNMTKAEAWKIIDGMAVWFKDVGEKHKGGDKRDGRTREECIFDSGIFAASEFVRRAMDGDENLSLAMHECCIWSQKQRQASSQGEP